MFRHVFPVNLLVGVLTMICNGCDANQKRHYETLAAANQQRMVEKGWVPSFISPDAGNIDLDGDLDSASVYGNYTSSDTSLLRKHCSSIDDSFRVPGYGPKWFSNDVKEAVTAGNLRHKGYEVLRCDDGFNVAVLSSHHFVSYWSTRYGQ